MTDRIIFYPCHSCKRELSPGSFPDGIRDDASRLCGSCTRDQEDRLQKAAREEKRKAPKKWPAFHILLRRPSACDLCGKNLAAGKRVRFKVSHNRALPRCSACAQKEKGRRGMLRKYGLTPRGYRKLLAGQGGLCAICKKPPEADRQLAVDHCHVTGRIRGLLCVRCNVALGALGDDLESIQRAADYLSRRPRRCGLNR